MSIKALIIGNSDGIGLAVTRILLKKKWDITGISRSKSSIEDPLYKHIVANVQDNNYVEHLKSIIDDNKPIDSCIYCAGIGELLDPSNMEKETEIFNVNLIGMVKTVTHVIPSMLRSGKGHFIGLSSVADEMLSSEAPSYHASKAGFSNYLESLALHLKPKGVFVTNVRFGFVDTKMAKSNIKPFMMSVDQAVIHLLKCIEKKPARYTAPKIIIPLIKFRDFILRLSL
ncbi:MAG: SDR family NAD(P)-dependent oxidoreductase [Endomicrobiales bacterium]|nr:SDR family NAD(P)-dependent oxidoreductase [Endomicrobiales bacterium]